MVVCRNYRLSNIKIYEALDFTITPSQKTYTTPEPLIPFQFNPIRMFCAWTCVYVCVCIFGLYARKWMFYLRKFKQINMCCYCRRDCCRLEQGTIKRNSLTKRGDQGKVCAWERERERDEFAKTCTLRITLNLGINANEKNIRIRWINRQYYCCSEHIHTLTYYIYIYYTICVRFWHERERGVVMVMVNFSRSCIFMRLCQFLSHWSIQYFILIITCVFVYRDRLHIIDVCLVFPFVFLHLDKTLNNTQKYFLYVLSYLL